MSERRARWVCLAIGLCSLVALVLTVTLIRTPLTHDEPWYLGEVENLHEHGFSAEFLIKLKGPAGPLHPVIHYSLEPLTNLEVPGVRLVNVAFFILTLLVVHRLLVMRGARDPLLSSMALASAPNMLRIAGVATTEITAAFFALLGIVFLLLALEAMNRSKWLAALAGAGGGLFLAASILGRSPFLVVVAALPALCIRARQNWLPVVCFGVGAVLLPSWVFHVWGGLVPPNLAIVGEGFALSHALFAAGYAGICVWVFAPRWFRIGWAEAGLGLVAVVALRLLGVAGERLPLESLAKSVIPDALLPLYGNASSVCLMLLGVVFWVSAVKRAWEARHDGVKLFLCLCAFSLVFTALKVTHLFSSRYVGQTIPFLLLACYDHDETASRGRCARMSIGFLVAYVSLVFQLKIL